MNKIVLILIIFIFLINNSLSKDLTDNLFFIGKMDSHDNKFSLYFKTRESKILSRGENTSYITDYPQDLYIYDYTSKKTLPLITYDWFPSVAKKILRDYDFPVFPEDFAYYLLKDNNTLIMVSANKNLSHNLIYDIKQKKLRSYETKSKLSFIISSYAKSCGYTNLNSTFECKLHKPLISQNLIN